MDSLFVIVGMSAVGKSTITHEFCEIDHSFEYFKNDKICNKIRDTFSIADFGTNNKDKWDRLEKIGNVKLLSYWLHLVLLNRIEGKTAFAEGYRYYLQEEREVLESAVDSVFNSCEIYYIHLDPPIKKRNKLRKDRGFNEVTKSQIEKELSKYDLGFVSQTIENKKDLERFVREKIDVEKNNTKGKVVGFPNVSFCKKSKRNLDNLKVINMKYIHNVLRAYIPYIKNIITRIVKK